jgi:erythromycin esterase-like protein
LHDAPASRRGSARDRQFFAVENARLVSDAERYYRMMFTEGARSWNFRDRHMVETLGALSRHLSIAMDTGEPRIVVWAHNSHLGDARATDMARRGELNVGQLVREQWGDAAVSVGFTTYSGTVTAASDWDAPAERKRVVPARADSYEGLMHEVAVEANEQRFMLDCAKPVVRDALPPRLLERAIGVIYRPDTERQSHYFFANISAQFDLLLHFDETCAVTPLDDAHMPTVADDAPDTFPSAL